MLTHSYDQDLCEQAAKGPLKNRQVEDRCADACLYPAARLDALDAATLPEDMNLPGVDFHALRDHVSTRYTVHVNGPLCITFEFRDGDAYALDFGQYY